MTPIPWVLGNDSGTAATGSVRPAFPAVEVAIVMLLEMKTLAGLRSGTVTLVFRRWQRPPVRAGGELTGADPRIGLREENKLSTGALRDLTLRLARILARSANGTRRVLDVIRSSPEVRAADLAAQLSIQKTKFNLPRFGCRLVRTVMIDRLSCDGACPLVVGS